MPSREELEKSEHVYRGVLLSVRRDTVRRGDGRRAVREVVEYPEVVAVVAMPSPAEVVLVRQWRHAVRQELLEVPAGKLAPGESPQEAAQRELEEEAGLVPGRLSLLGAAYSTPGFTEEKIHFFLATDLQRVPPRPDEDEEIEVEVVPLAQAVAWVREGRLHDVKTVAALLWAAHSLGGPAPS